MNYSTIDHDAAENACNVLIEAYCNGNESVEWEDIQTALGHALLAFNLPANYVEVENIRRVKLQDELDKYHECRAETQETDLRGALRNLVTLVTEGQIAQGLAHNPHHYQDVRTAVAILEATEPPMTTARAFEIVLELAKERTASIGDDAAMHAKQMEAHDVAHDFVLNNILR